MWLRGKQKSFKTVSHSFVMGLRFIVDFHDATRQNVEFQIVAITY
jgi:hypothetical protein